MAKWSIIRGSHFRKVVGHGSLYFVASVLSKAINALMLPIYTRCLAPEEYAVYSNLFAIASLAGVFTSLYMDNAYARLYFDTKNDLEARRRLFSSIFFFMLAWGGVAALMLFFAIRGAVSAAYDVQVFPYVVLICIIPLVRQFNALGSSHYRNEHRSSLVAGASFLWCLAASGVSLLLLLGVGLKAQALLWGILAGDTLVLVIYYLRLSRDGLIGSAFSVRVVREALVYSLGLLPLTAASWLSGYSDRLLITWFGSLAESGIYSVAFEIGRLINMIVLATFMAYGPMVFAMLKERGEKDIARIEQFQMFFFHFLIGAAFFLSLFTPEIFRLLVNPRYYDAIPWVPVIAVSFVFAGARKLYATPIYYHKLTLLVSLGGILQAALSLGLNVMWIPTFGGGAAAWAKLASMALVAAYFCLLCRKYEPLRFDWRAFGVTFGILAVCCFLWALAAYGLALPFWPLLAVKIALLGLALFCTWRSRYGDVLRRALERDA